MVGTIRPPETELVEYKKQDATPVPGGFLIQDTNQVLHALKADSFPGAAALVMCPVSVLLGSHGRSPSPTRIQDVPCIVDVMLTRGTRRHSIIEDGRVGLRLRFR